MTRPPIEERQWVEAQRYRGPFPIASREARRLERQAEVRVRAEVTAAGYRVVDLEQEWRRPRGDVLVTTALGHRPAA